jgi:hypothetical protein
MSSQPGGRHSAVPITQQSVPASYGNASASNKPQRSSLQYGALSRGGDGDGSGDQQGGGSSGGGNALLTNGGTKLDTLCDVLPQASREVLATYLDSNGGSDLAAIGAYLEDEKLGRV